MENYADLNITLSKPAVGTYAVELRFSRSDDPGERPPEKGPARFEFSEMRRESLDPKAYGQLLSNALFANETQSSVREFFKECLAVTQNSDLKLRLRVLVDRSAPELHDIRWETIGGLEDDEFLALNRDRLFSRFLYSSDWSRIELRPKKELRALVVISNPADLEQGVTLPIGRELTKVALDGEMRRAQEGLKGVLKIDVLESRRNEPGRVTSQNLESQLKKGYDILYLVCHGALMPEDRHDPDSPRRPYLWLENQDGTSFPMSGLELAEQVRHLSDQTRPRLIILASCQSGGKGQVPGHEQTADQGALAAIGPRLVEVGVPAVLAMQDNVMMKTVEQFVPVFFEELLKDGRVDRAMMEARWKIRHLDDWWVPVLYLRLRGGRLWYKPGFAGQKPEFDVWPSIINSIQQKYCIPVLGSELWESLSGSLSEIAQTWSTEMSFPLPRHALEDFPQVAQYLSISQGPAFPRDHLLQHIRGRLLEEYAPHIPPEAQQLPVMELISAVQAQRSKQNSTDAYSLLASLPFEIYLNTNPDSLLEEALRAQVPPREPQVLHFCWKSRLITAASIKAYQSLQPPSVERPLVYHLFGHIMEPLSLVLTEDDYFEYLMWVNKTDSPIPIPDLILRTWRENALLFLGFRLSDWNFRVLFRSIFNAERRSLGRDYRSVAVQLQPGDDSLHPELARNYLEKYFPSDKFDIYWGSTKDFLNELWDQFHDKDKAA